MGISEVCDQPYCVQCVGFPFGEDSERSETEEVDFREGLAAYYLSVTALPCHLSSQGEALKCSHVTTPNLRSTALLEECALYKSCI